jgi:hypothetical protein
MGGSVDKYGLPAGCVCIIEEHLPSRDTCNIPRTPDGPNEPNRYCGGARYSACEHALFARRRIPQRCSLIPLRYAHTQTAMVRPEGC